jgi:spore maturation protein CgeB
MVINIHRDSLWSHHGDRNARRIEATHLNPRFWEAGACGAFQIVSYRSDLDTVAPEVPSFQTPLELLSLVDHYLSDIPARNQIAQAVRERLAEHSYRSRAGDVLRAMQLSDKAGIH